MTKTEADFRIDTAIRLMAGLIANRSFLLFLRSMDIQQQNERACQLALDLADTLIKRHKETSI